MTFATPASLAAFWLVLAPMAQAADGTTHVSPSDAGFPVSLDITGDAAQVLLESLTRVPVSTFREAKDQAGHDTLCSKESGDSLTYYCQIRDEGLPQAQTVDGAAAETLFDQLPSVGQGWRYGELERHSGGGIRCERRSLASDAVFSAPEYHCYTDVTAAGTFLRTEPEMIGVLN